MEALLFTGVGISLFCLGLATGVILQNKLIKVQSIITEQHNEVTDRVIKIEPLLVSLADQLKRDYINHTPCDYQIKDPDETMEIPEYEIRGSRGKKKETW
jgi:hypothetical protein